MTRHGQRIRSYVAVLAVCALLMLLILFVYARTFHYPFVNFDDPFYIRDNAHVQAGLTSESVRWAFTNTECFWHPLTWLSLELDAALDSGANAGGFHRTNVLLHTLSTLGLFLVLRRMTRATGRSAMVAALFAVHPLNVESVAWVAERKGVLSTLCWMLTLAAYVAYVERPSIGRYALVVGAFVLGLMAKPMLVTLPVVLLLLDYWPLGRIARADDVQVGRASSWRWLVLEKLPLFALAFAAAIVAYAAENQGKALPSLEEFPLPVRVLNALLAYAGYLRMMIWPTGLAIFYPHPGADVSVPAALASAVLLIAATVLVLSPGRRRYLAVGWLWYLLTLLPVIGFVQIGRHAMADRYTYVPLIGVFVALTWGISDLAAFWQLRRRMLVALSAVVVSGGVVLSSIQVRCFSSDFTLWARAVQVTDHNGPAHRGVGMQLYLLGRLDEAEAHLRQAVALMPASSRAACALGEVLHAKERSAEAEEHLRKAIALDPQFAWPYYVLGDVLRRQGRLEEAIAEYRQALARGIDEARGPLQQCERELAL